MNREKCFHLGKLGRWVASLVLAAGCAHPAQEQGKISIVYPAAPTPLSPGPSVSREPIRTIAGANPSEAVPQWTSAGTVFACRANCALIPLSTHGNLVLAPEYTPQNLTSINGSTQHSVTQETATSLDELILNLRQKGIKVTVNSAFRPHDQQREIYKSQPSISAPPGRSEHQLGTTVDLQYPFQSQQFVINAAYQHGFVATTMRDDLGVPPEPWHFRYVGKKTLDEYDVWAANQRNIPGQSDSFQIFLHEKMKCTLPDANKRDPTRCPRRKCGRTQHRWKRLKA